MIEANELRPGNAILYDGDVRIIHIVNAKWKQVGLEIEGSSSGDGVYLRSLYPIPFTTKTLESNNLYCETFGSDKTYLRSDDNGDIFLLCDFVKVSENPVKYVHQLQNLYFALTGKEPIINLHQLQQA